MTAIVRLFRSGDREALLQIGAETAFFGAPIEKYMEDRRIFMDAFYSYYTDCEPEHAWVADDEGQIAGFLTGCVDTHRHDRIWARKILPAAMWKFLTGKYHTGPKLWQYVRAMLKAARHGHIPGADLSLYPAHLHINLLPAWRGQGLGRGLIEAYLNQLRSLGVKGVHLQTTSYNVAACHLYERVGFQILEHRPTKMYAHLVDEPVEALCYGMRLI
jgi:ribosomal protein S18 acetylase RimI-like enzyme